MIKSKFSIVTNIRFNKGVDFQSCYADKDNTFEITFSGNRVYNISGIEPKKLYANILLCWDDGYSSLFTVLKTNRIYNLDNILRDKSKMITYMVEHSELLSDFENLDDIEVFSKL